VRSTRVIGRRRDVGAIFERGFTSHSRGRRGARSRSWREGVSARRSPNAAR